MAEDIKPTVPLTQNAVAAANDATIRQQASQDISGQPTNPVSVEATSTALDSMMDAIVKAKDTEGVPVAPVVPATPAPAVPAVPAEPAAPAIPDATADPATATDDPFKGIELPTNAKSKSSEAFAQLKERANSELTSRDTKIKELNAEVERLKEIEANPIPEDFRKEYETLKEFRDRMDVSLDPKFKEFDVKANTASDFIYDQLRRTGVVTEEHIKKIQGYGGPSEVNFEKIFGTINNTTTQRLIENKLAELEGIRFEKNRAVEAAKLNINEYMKGREQEFSQASVAHNTQTKETLDKLISGMDWFKPVKSEDKKIVAEHDAFVGQVKKDLESALTDDSPKMRALLIAGMGQLLYSRRLIPQLQSELAGIKTKHQEEVTKLTADLKAATDRIEKIKASSRSRLPESAAPSAGLPSATKKPEFNVPATQALDDAMKNIMEKKALAASNS